MFHDTRAPFGWRCSRCKGTDVQVQVWADVNQGYAVPYKDRRHWCMEGPDGVWCRSCEDHEDLEPAPMPVPTADDVLDWLDQVPTADWFACVGRAQVWLDTVAVSTWADDDELERTRHALDLVWRVLYRTLWDRKG